MLTSSGYGRSPCWQKSTEVSRRNYQYSRQLTRRRPLQTFPDNQPILRQSLFPTRNVRSHKRLWLDSRFWNCVLMENWLHCRFLLIGKMKVRSQKELCVIWDSVLTVKRFNYTLEFNTIKHGQVVIAKAVPLSHSCVPSKTTPCCCCC